MSDLDEPKQSDPRRASPVLWNPSEANGSAAASSAKAVNDRIHEPNVQQQIKKSDNSAGKSKLKGKNRPSLKLVDLSRPDETTDIIAPVEKPAFVRYSAAFSDIPNSERPRERFMAYGPAALSASELIALLLRTGSAQRNVTALADHLLAHLGGLGRLAEISAVELEAIEGIGRAKAIEIMAALELGRRISTLTPEERPTVNGPRDVSTLLQSELRYLKKETLKSILLDAKNRVIAIKTVSIGDLTSSIVHPREVFRDAIVNSAASIIVAHNHPSGDPTPSADDVNITRRLISVGETIGIELLDHIVIGDEKFVSLKEKGLI